MMNKPIFYIQNLMFCCLFALFSNSIADTQNTINSNNTVQQQSKNDVRKAHIVVQQKQKDWYCTNRPQIKAAVKIPGIITVTNNTHKLTANNNYKKKLEECQQIYNTNQDLKYLTKNYSNGLEYLNNNGYPLIEIPDYFQKKLKEDIHKSNKIISSSLVKKEKALKKNIDNAILLEMAKDATINRDNYETVNKIALTTIQYEAKKTTEDYERKKKDYKNAANLYSKNKFGPNAKMYKQRALNIRKEGLALKKKSEGYNRDIKALERFQTGVDVGFDIKKMHGIYNDATSKDGRKKAKALMESASLAHKYFKKYKDNYYNLSDFKKLAEMKDKDFETYVKKAGSLNNASFMVNKVQRAGELALKAYDEYKKYQEIKNYSIKLYNDGSYSEAQANLLTAFRGMSHLSSTAAAYMPKGMSDLVSYYAEAMKTPEKMDRLIREMVDRPDVFADIKGTQAKSTVMKLYNQDKNYGGKSLDRDNFLFRKAGLHIYQVDNPTGNMKPYVVMAKNDKPPIYIDANMYKQLEKYAFYYPIVNKKQLSDGDLYQLLTKNINDIGLKALKKKAEVALQEAAKKQKIANMFGKKKLTKDDERLWKKFNLLMLQSLPSMCALKSKFQKSLFGKYQNKEAREQVIAWLKNYGQQLKDAKSNSLK